MRLFEIIDNSTISLYRGMSLDEFDRLRMTGIYTPNIHNPHNDATTNLETARYYASTKIHDDEGVVILFDVPVSMIRQDDIFPEDYKIIKSFKLTNYKIV